MANPQSPVDSNDIAITVGRGEMLVVRVAADVGVLVLIRVGDAVDATHADYFLTGGDAVEITPRIDTVVNLKRETGTPLVYYRLERNSLVN